MKKKNGFTLIEILVVITLVVIVVLIVGVNFVRMANEQKYKDYQRTIEMIEDAAKAYVGLNEGNSKTLAINNGNTNISLTQLVNEGYLEEEDLIDARTSDKEPLSGTMTVTVTYSSSVFSYCFNEEKWNCATKELSK